jgi:hypothetical protein
MTRTLKTLRVVQWSLLVSIMLYAVAGELLGPPVRGADPTLSYIFSTLAVGIVGTIFVVRRTLVQRAAEILITRPDDNLSLDHWKSGYLTTYVLCEALAVFGLVLRFRGSQMEQSLLFYVGGFVLILFFRAKQPATAPTT